MAGFHSLQSPSKIDRLATCPASFHATQGVQEFSKPDTVLGTAAHEIHERCLHTGRLAEEFIGEVIYVDEVDKPWFITVDDEMAQFVQESVDRCNETPGLHFVEKRVDVSEFSALANQSGKADFFSIDSNTLYVFDFKYGKGVRVDAYKNLQLLYYALGVLVYYGCMYEIEKVVIRVHQPRIDNWDEWVTTPKELFELGYATKARLELTLAVNPPYQPSDKGCRFCPIKSTCKARGEFVRRIAMGHFDDLDDGLTTFDTEFPEQLVDSADMTLDELIAVHRHMSQVKDFLHSVERELLRLMLNGTEVEGLKLVESVSRRRYVDAIRAKKAARYLIEHGVKPELAIVSKTASPATAEKLIPRTLRKEFNEQFIDKPRGRPTVVPVTDKREPYVGLNASMFDDLDAEDEDSKTDDL